MSQQHQATSQARSAGKTIEHLRQVSEEQGKCVCCGAKINKYWHRLTPVLVQALVKTLELVREQDNNLVQKADLDLTHSQYGNYQKLRFHGLIAKHRDDEGNFDGWLITDRGGKFLRGELSVPMRVQTFRNKVVEHDEQTVYIRDVLGYDLNPQQYFEPEKATDVELQQASLLDDSRPHYNPFTH